MKTLITYATLLGLATTLSAQITVDNPTGSGNNVTSQTFFQELGNYSAADFNGNADTILVNFDDAKFTGQTVSSVLFDAGTSGFDYRINFGLFAGGFGRIITTDSQFVSSSPQAAVWGNGSGATIVFPEFTSGSTNNQDIYGVGFTVARLETSLDIRFYSDEAGNNQIGSTITLSANNGDSGYSFVGYAGTETIRRVDIDTGGLTNSFSIDDVIVVTTPIPEPAQQSVFFGGIVAVGLFLRRLTNKRAQ